MHTLYRLDSRHTNTVWEDELGCESDELAIAARFFDKLKEKEGNMLRVLHGLQNGDFSSYKFQGAIAALETYEKDELEYAEAIAGGADPQELLWKQQGRVLKVDTDVGGPSEGEEESDDDLGAGRAGRGFRGCSTAGSLTSFEGTSLCALNCVPSTVCPQNNRVSDVLTISGHCRLWRRSAEEGTVPCQVGHVPGRKGEDGKRREEVGDDHAGGWASWGVSEPTAGQRQEYALGPALWGMVCLL
jgi:hypothetical protein